MKDFLTLYEAGAVQRWHTWPTLKTQDVAAHSWGVAMILHRIAPKFSGLIVYALTHDLHEVESGDAPYHAKLAFPELKAAISKQEQQFIDKHNLWEPITEKEHQFLKWADMFELLLWCFREQDLGNRRISLVIQRAYDALNSIGFPNEEAKLLFEEVHNGRK